jgi:hypothetical protein
MNISDVIAKLDSIGNRYGDIEVTRRNTCCCYGDDEPPVESVELADLESLPTYVVIS